MEKPNAEVLTCPARSSQLGGVCGSGLKVTVQQTGELRQSGGKDDPGGPQGATQVLRNRCDLRPW